jgi:hypothetical protein
VEIFGYKKDMTTNFFLPLSFVAVFVSGITDKHPVSAKLISANEYRNKVFAKQ